jgi:cytoskeletal protein RodZ
MLESSDYSQISDQLYLVPFLRRYATFLELDPEEMAIRFVREVQRADSSPPGVRMSEPLIGERRKRARIGPAVGMIALLAVGICAFLVMQRHRENSAGLAVPAAASTLPSRAGN